VDETDLDMLWNGSEEVANIRVRVKKMEAATLTGKGGKNVTCLVY
jgi:hypothetical protein